MTCRTKESGVSQISQCAKVKGIAPHGNQTYIHTIQPKRSLCVISPMAQSPQSVSPSRREIFQDLQVDSYRLKNFDGTPR